MNLEIVKEFTGGRHIRVFAYDRYLAILNEGTEPLCRQIGCLLGQQA